MENIVGGMSSGQVVVGAARGRQLSRTETCTTDCYIKNNDIMQVLQVEADIQLLNELLKWM